MKKIGIASDHAGYEMKEFLVGYLNAMGYEVLDFGAHSPESVDYADFAHPLAEAIENGELENVFRVEAEILSDSEDNSPVFYAKRMKQ